MKKMPFARVQLAAVATSFVLSLLLTPLVRSLARRRGMVAQPKADRWHKKPTAMFGGVAIWLSVLIVYACFCASGHRAALNLWSRDCRRRPRFFSWWAWSMTSSTPNPIKS